MTDKNPATDATTETQSQDETPTVVLTRLQSIAINHPRLTKVAVIVGALGTAGFVGLTANNLQKNKHRVDAAQDHLALAAGEFSEAVSPTSENTDA